MGWIKEAVVLFIGLALLGTGLFLFGIICIGYVILTFRSGKGKNTPGAQPSRLQISPRYILGAALAAISLVAWASGGILSPVFFGALAALAFLWPQLPFERIGSGVAPVPGTILLRSRLFPFVWHAVAEVKPGAEDLARALSSFEGKLIIVKQRGFYAHAKTMALDASSAEAKVTEEFRRMTTLVTQGHAYFLPLDSAASATVFGNTVVPSSSNGDGLGGAPPDVMVLEASGGFVSKSGSYDSIPHRSTRPMIPTSNRTVRHPPLVWEVLEGLGKKLKLPEPDSFSNLLQSIHSSRNEPLSERLAGLESSGDGVKVTALPGDQVELSRAQLRAIVSIYS